MPAPQLYDDELPDVGASYFANDQRPFHRDPRASMAMHMQRRMRPVPAETARYPHASSAPRYGSVEGEWPSAPARRMSLSDDPSLSPTAFRDHRSPHHHADESGRISPSSDGVVLPTLSTMLHNSWPPQWPPRTEAPGPAPTMSTHMIPPTHRRAPSLSVSTSPNFTAATHSRASASSWDADADTSSASLYSPMHLGTPRSEIGDESMQFTPRAASGSSSPSSFSTVSAMEDNQHDDSKPNSPSPKGDRKTSRYLREMDRRAILERLARGEKQATLAKEYNVSRAAICNLFKHRHEVMARTDEDPFAKHPKKRKNKKTLKSRRSRSLRLATASTSQSGDSRAVVTPPTAPTSVNQVQSDSVLLLLTIMSDRRSSADEFRRASERVLWLLIEEALSAVPIKLTQVTIAAESKIMGVTTEHPPCAISMEQRSSPMLEVFQLLEPERPFGQIRVLDASTHACSLVDAHLPPTLKYHNVFLFDIAVVSTDTMRAMIECAKERGALEVMIYVVALFISADVVEMLQHTYPHVRVVTTQIESNILEAQKNRRSCVDVVLGRFDQVYQTQYTLV